MKLPAKQQKNPKRRQYKQFTKYWKKTICKCHSTSFICNNYNHLALLICEFSISLTLCDKVEVKQIRVHARLQAIFSKHFFSQTIDLMMCYCYIMSPHSSRVFFDGSFWNTVFEFKERIKIAFNYSIP